MAAREMEDLDRYIAGSRAERPAFSAALELARRERRLLRELAEPQRRQQG